MYLCFRHGLVPHTEDDYIMKILTIVLNKRCLDARIVFALAICMATALIIFTFFMPDILPLKYFFDAYGVTYFMNSGGNFVLFGDSFENTGVLLSELGFVPGVLPVLGVILISLSIYFAFLRGGQRIPIGLAIFACIWAVVMTIYIGQPSKELLVAALVLAFLVMARTKYGLAFWLVLALLYACYFRQYWFVVLAMFGSTYILGRWLNSFYRWTMLIVLYYGILAFYVDIFMGQPLSSWRNEVNVGRELDPDSMTIIASILPGEDVLSSLINAMGALVMLIFPLPLLMLGQIQHLAAFALIPSSLLLAFLANQRLLKDGRHNMQTYSAVRLLFSYIVVQGLFEPDYGSFLKHLSPFAPVILYLLAASVPIFHRGNYFSSAYRA